MIKLLTCQREERREKREKRQVILVVALPLLWYGKKLWLGNGCPIPSHVLIVSFCFDLCLVQILDYQGTTHSQIYYPGEGFFGGILPIPLAFGPISLYFIYDIGRPQGRYPNKLTKTIQRKKNCQATYKWPFKQIKSLLLYYQLIVLNQPVKLIKNIHQQRFFYS